MDKRQNKWSLAGIILSAAIAGAALWLILIGQVFEDWAHLPFRINPIAFGIGPLQVHWYGLMYVAALLTSYSLAVRRLRIEPWDIREETLADFLNWAILGVLLGGRIGYVLFYKAAYFFQNPLDVFWPFQFDGQRWVFGIYGMSYHGGLIGVLVVTILFCRRRKIGVLKFGDLIVPTIPIGYAFGRLGNFIDGEFYGRVTTAPWGMFFPMDETGQLRHPSQLYEMFFEGIVLFAILWPIRNRPWAKGRMFGLYLIGYGIARFGIEFFREPDAHLGYFFGGVTMGQILCLVMVAAGVLFSNKNLFDKKTN